MNLPAFNNICKDGKCGECGDCTQVKEWAKNAGWYDNDCGKCGECGDCTQGEPGNETIEEETRRLIYEDNLVGKDELIREW